MMEAYEILFLGACIKPILNSYFALPSIHSTLSRLSDDYYYVYSADYPVFTRLQRYGLKPFDIGLISDTVPVKQMTPGGLQSIRSLH